MLDRRPITHALPDEGETLPESRSQKRVLLLQRRLPEYRVAFFERLREVLGSRGVELSLVHGPPDPEAVQRADQGRLPWATAVATGYLQLLGGQLTFQRIPRRLWSRADLIIAPHEAGYLPGYSFLLRNALGRARLAFWGHGVDPSRDLLLRHRLKRFTSRFPDWWFAYTELSAERIVAAGFPRERITCVENAVDTAEAVARCQSLESHQAALRAELGIASKNIAVFLGSLTRDKRLDLLVGACDLVRNRMPDFHLVVVGDGPLMPRMRVAAALRPWLHVVGALRGCEKIACCSLAKVMLNPGMVGLNVVDAFALGTPMVTTSPNEHSPEIAYLVPGENGLMTAARREDFAAAVELVLRDEVLWQRLQSGCVRAAARYTIQRMASRFADGISSALAVAPLRHRASPRHSVAAGRDARSPGGQPMPAANNETGATAPSGPLRVLILHPALAPYRVDFFNALASRCALRVVFLHANAREQKFDQAQLQTAITAEVGYLTRGATILNRTVRIGVRREIQHFHPDVVVTPEFSPTTLAVAAQRRFLPMSLAHVVWTDDNPMSVSRDVWARRAARVLSLRAADGLIVLSDETAAMYRARYHAQKPIGVSPLLQDEDAFRERLRHAVPIAEERAAEFGLIGRRVLLSVGRLAKEKRLDRLLAAFARVRETVSNVILVVVGDGPERSRLQRLATSLGVEQYTVFAGHHEAQSLHAWYVLGSVFALTSQYEPFGAVVNEALLAGLPVVCSDRAGARTLICKGENGSVLDASDANVLADALARWVRPATPLAPPLAVLRPSLMRHPFQDSVQAFLAALHATRGPSSRWYCDSASACHP